MQYPEIFGKVLMLDEEQTECLSMEKVIKLSLILKFSCFYPFSFLPCRVSDGLGGLAIMSTCCLTINVIAYLRILKNNN